MKKRIGMVLLFLMTAVLTTGCAMRTVEQMYCVPRRSQSFSHVQKAMDMAMSGLEYAAPISGENQQTVQLADLDGDGVDEYILFARSPSKSPLDILIFDTDEDDQCYLLEVIELQGSAFEKVEYVELDEAPGLELVVGRQVSDQLLGSVSAYSFASGRSQRLISANYSHFLTCDLDRNGKSELLLIQPGELGQPGESTAVALSYQFENETMERSVEIPLSAKADGVRRIIEGKLQDSAPAVFISSTVGDSAIVTDILANDEGKLLNLGQEDSSVQPLKNYYVYVTDINDDGITEIPSLIPMTPIMEGEQTENQYLIHWYSVDLAGKHYDKEYTFHNYGAGWYLQLDPAWATRISTEKAGSTYVFYLWNQDKTSAQLLFTIYAFTGSDRDQEASRNDRFPLYRMEGVAYAAKLHQMALDCGVTEEYMKNNFHLIHQDWKTGET